MRLWRYTFRIEPRRIVSARKTLFARLLALVVALIVAGILLALVGVNPVRTYLAMLGGAVGTPAQWAQGNFNNIGETLVKAIPIILTSLAVLIAFRMLFWNIGADGQMAMGAIAATGVALFFPGLLHWWPRLLYLPAMFLLGALAGGLWGLIPAILKLSFNVNEIISTIMLNFIALLFAEFLYFGPWRDPGGMGFPGTAIFPEFARLPRLFMRVHVGIIFALVAAGLLWLLLEYTRWGYEIKVMGHNRQVARYAGMPLVRNVLTVMLISGGLAGIAGMSEVSGLAFRLQQGVLTFGFANTAIIVAWLANLRVWNAVLIAILMSALLVGGDQIQIMLGLPAAVALVLEGLLLFSVLAGEFFIRYRVKMHAPDQGQKQSGLEGTA